MFGQLGQCDRITKECPTKVVFSRPVFIVDLSGKYFHWVALDQEGKVWIWGKEQAMCGQAILDRYGETIDFQNLDIDQLGPREVKEVLGYYNVVKIDAGLGYSATLTKEGYLYTWGINLQGQLGLGILDETQHVKVTSIPRRVEKIQGTVVDMSCGENHMLALIQNQFNKQVYSWGSSKQGQCGHGDFGQRLLPKKIEAIQNEEIAQISAGAYHSLILTKYNKLYGCGSNKNKALGNIKLTQCY